MKRSPASKYDRQWVAAIAVVYLISLPLPSYSVQGPTGTTVDYGYDEAIANPASLVLNLGMLLQGLAILRGRKFSWVGKTLSVLMILLVLAAGMGSLMGDRPSSVVIENGSARIVWFFAFLMLQVRVLSVPPLATTDANPP